MDNLINYIKENGQKTYDELKFNEIDAAVYCVLSYINFDGINITNIKIKDLYEIYIKKFTLKEKDKFNQKNRELFNIMSKSIRYKNNFVTDYKKINNKITQFQALAIKVPHHFKFIAFEGTDDLLVGWEEDFKMSYLYPVPAEEHAKEFLNSNIKFNDFVVYVAGHSKGGRLAITSSMEQSRFKKYQIDYIFNFDGPGVLPEVTNEKKYLSILKKVRNYYPEESIVGMIFESMGKKIITKSTAFKIYQHSIHTWKINNNKFETGSLSKESKEFHLKIENVINKFSEEERKYFVTTFFNLLYTSGYTFKSELKKISPQKMKNLLKETTSLNENERKLILEMFKTLIKNTSFEEENKNNVQKR